MSRAVELLRKGMPKLATACVLLLAACAAYFLYIRSTTSPWTRDGQVRADIVKITPEVNGNLVSVAVHDNQVVKRGDLLFLIDADSYQLAVDKAKASLAQARDDVAALAAVVEVAEAQLEEAQVGVTSADRQVTAAEASVRSAKAAVDQAKAGVTSAEQLINQRSAELKNAQSEAARAKRLVDRKAGAIEDAESTAATAVAREAQLASAKAGLLQAQAALAQAEAKYDEARVNIQLAQDGRSEAAAAEASALAALNQSKATLGQPGDQNVRVRSAQVSLAQAELDLERSRIVSPCNGYISNLAVSEGSYAVVGQPLVAIVDRDSFRVHAYFQENKLRHIGEGDPARVTLMAQPDRPLQGVVENIGKAVNPPNVAPTEGQAGEVPQIQPTFDWVRLPQRVPVRIRLTETPEDLQLISGTTASVSVDAGE